MSIIGGYQSDLDLQKVKYVGDFPVENSLGGFGETTGTGNNYQLALNPPISKYREGLPLEVKFHAVNTGTATLNVDGKGAVPLKKISNGVLVPLEAGDIKAAIHYLVYDGTSFQVATGILPSFSIDPATEAKPGIAGIATQTETIQGTNDEKFVTPLKLAAYISDKITGLWKDKGTINCSTNPVYPAAKKGDAYTVSSAGLIGGAGGEPVQVRDVIYCTADTTSGTSAQVAANWNIVQANLDQATETVAGILRIATQTQVNTGSDDATAVTPKKLKSLLATLLIEASETVSGLARIATQQLVNSGLDDKHYVTPLKLATLLELQTGNKLLFKNVGTVGVPVGSGTQEVELGASYTLLAGELKNKQGLRICGNGEFQPQNRKTFRIYIGSWLLISNTIEQSPTGSFQFEIVFYKITTYQLKGWASLLINDTPPEIKHVQTAGLAVDTEDTVIRTTGQSSREQPGSVVRYNLTIEKLV
ncbi:hypothetical protein GCM10009122_23340 [Fulvivirga kasyanovii]|uniref:Uncharacterized protein n=1 Tax=Fulvivirga kasyanovii TaxID=396812 RepID=A0ABW9RYT1_9BACT|nr:hypothetical protein [Fulvivirga kasyanovii]MTI28960.1 hypothetical protein [Fulvivirga kasyanovii]